MTYEQGIAAGMQQAARMALTWGKLASDTQTYPLMKRLHDAILDAIPATVEPEPPAVRWHTIATAPTDGTRMDIWVPGVGIIAKVTHARAYHNATHWRPEPPAPAGEDRHE